MQLDIDKLVYTFQDKTASMLLQSGLINIEFWKNVSFLEKCFKTYGNAAMVASFT